MDQKSIVVFLDLKGLLAKAKDLYTFLVQILGSDAIPSSTVTTYALNDIALQNEPEAKDRAEDQSFSITNNAILKALEMMLFASVRQIAKITLIIPATGLAPVDEIASLRLEAIALSSP
jgi:hypothetical protein